MPVRPITGPIPYKVYCQRVRRHRRTEILLGVAALNATLQRAKFSEGPDPSLPNVVQPFSLAGLARTALVSGNDYRHTPVSVEDLIDMCALWVNIDEPAFKIEPGADRLRSMLSRLAYEQFGHQISEMENVGRTLVLLKDHASNVPTAPTPDEWRVALGVDLEQFMRLGFAMHVAALQNGGCIDRAVLKMDHVAAIFSPLDADQALESVDKWFAASPQELAEAGRAEEVAEAEKWSLNPLVEKPIVRLTDGRYVMPWTRLVVDRITPTGLYFIGLELFGRRFTDALVTMFEQYIGAQLKMLCFADVHPEVAYDRKSKRTVDYFIVTDEVTILVEVKASRPIRATRLGTPEGDDDLVHKIGQAYRQIDNSARLLAQRHPELAHIPADRPVCGLVVTLEPFHWVNTLYDNVLERPITPTTVATAHELEGLVATLQDAPDVGRRLLAALMVSTQEGQRLASAYQDRPIRANPLLEDAWKRFSQPWGDWQDTHPRDPDPHFRRT